MLFENSGVRQGENQKQLVAHHFALNRVLQAYNTFGNAMKERALKVNINKRLEIASAGSLTTASTRPPIKLKDGLRSHFSRRYERG